MSRWIASAESGTAKGEFEGKGFSTVSGKPSCGSGKKRLKSK